MTPSSRSRFFGSSLAMVASVSTLLLGGCAMGSLNLSGTPTEPSAVRVSMSGRVHGGQQPVAFSTIALWTVGATGYGSAGANLITPLTTGTGYYAGGATGCSVASFSPTSYTLANGTITWQASAIPASFTVGQRVQISDVSPAGANVGVITAVSGSSLSASVPVPGTFSGSDAGPVALKCETTTITDANGNFTITGDYTLPSTDAQTYVTAAGGNPGLATGTNNTAIMLAAPLGLASQLSSSTQVVISEVTTAAMAFAAGQYFTPTYGASSADNFGTSGTTQGKLGLTNAFATVGRLADTTSGLPMSAQVLGNSTTGTITATPDTAKVALIADILAACVNDTGATGTNCTKLLRDVTPTYAPGSTTTTATAATDTLQAAVYMSLNATSTNATSSSSNMTELFGLAPAAGPYSGYHSSITTAPTDWTVAISYGSSVTGAGGPVLYEPQFFAFDAGGNLWLANYGDDLVELSPTGVPLFVSPATFGVAVPYSVVVDPSGNTWMPNGYAATGGGGASNGKQIVEYTSTGSYNYFPTANIPYSLVSDAKGDIFILEGANSTVEELVAGASAVSAVASTGMTTSKYSTMVMDSGYNLWITTGASNTTIYEIPYTAGAYGAAVAVTSSAIVEGEPLAIDNGNNLWVGNYSTSAPSTAKIPAATPGSGVQYAVTGATKGIEGVAIDGAGNAWFSNYVSTTTNSFYELSNAGVELSPTTGWAHAAYDPKGIAVDPSGNVWIGSGSTSLPGAQLVELVGGGVPVVTPIAAGLPAAAGGTSTIGTKP